MSNPLEDLIAIPKRTRVHDSIVSVKLPSAVVKMLVSEADRRGVSVSAVVRESIGDYLGRKGYRDAG